MYYGTLSKGHCRTTKNQLKKHKYQMRKLEKDAILKKLKEINLSSLRYSRHSLHKIHMMYEKKIINNCFTNTNLREMIVEFNVNKSLDNQVDCRVLIRDNDSYEVKFMDYNNGIESIKKANIPISMFYHIYRETGVINNCQNDRIEKSAG